MVCCAGKLIENLKLFYKSNRPYFLWVYWRDNPLGMLGEHSKKLVNNEPKASDLQAFLVFPQHPEWVIKPVNPKKVCSIASLFLNNF